MTGISSRPSRPKPCAGPGVHRDLPEAHVAELGERLLHHVEPAAGERAGDEHQVAAQQLALQHLGEAALVRRQDARAVGLRAGVAGGRGEGVAVDVDDLAGRRRRADVDQLGAGAEDGDPRAGPHQHALAADGGQQADLRRADRGADLDGGVAGRDVVPGAADVAAGRRRRRARRPARCPGRSRRRGRRRRRRPAASRPAATLSARPGPIEDGVLAPGDALPHDRELHRRLRRSRRRRPRRGRRSRRARPGRRPAAPAG